MPSPITWPLSPWMRWALTLAAGGAAYLYDLLESDAVDDTLEWRRLQVVWARTPAMGTEDNAINTFDLQRISSTGPETEWDSARYAAAEARFDTFFTAYKPYCKSHVKVAEYRWYRRRFFPLAGAPGVAPSGPPERVTTKSIAGTSAGVAFPPQVALSVTEKTAWPKHWGRFYLPWPSASISHADDGRVSPTTSATLLAAAGALYEGLTDDGNPIVVPVTQVDNDPAKVLLSVTELQIDNVFDVIRSRRNREGITRAVFPL